MDPENQFFESDGTPGASLDELNLCSDDHVCDSSPDLVSFNEEILIPPTPTSEENSSGVNNVAITTTAHTTAPRRRRSRKRKQNSENVESGEGSSTAPREKYKKSKKSHGEGTSRTYKGVSRYRTQFGAFKCDPTNPKKETVYLGGYDVEKDAARAYDLAALRFSGKTAETNFPSANYEKDLEEMESLDRREYLLATKRKCNAYVQGSSKFRGVSRNLDTGRWQAKVGKGKDRKGIYLGVFDTEKEAAKAYDVAAIKLFSANAPTNYPRNRYNVQEIMKSDKFLIGEGASNLIRRHSVKDLLLMKQRRYKSSAVKDGLMKKQGSTSPENELPVTKSSVKSQPPASSPSGEQVVLPLHEGNVVRRAIDDDFPSKVTAIFQEMCPFDPPQTLPSLPNLDFQLQNNPYCDSQIQPQYSNYAVPPPQMGSGLFPKLAGETLEVQPSDGFVSIFGLDKQNPLFDQSPTAANQYLQQEEQVRESHEHIDILNFSELQYNNGMQFNSDSAQFHPGLGYANPDTQQQQQQQQQVPADSHFNSSSAIFNPSLGFASQYMQPQLLLPDSPGDLFGLTEEEADQFLENFLNKNGGYADIGSDNNEGLASNADKTCNFLFNLLDTVPAGTTANEGLDSLEPIGPYMGFGSLYNFRPHGSA